MIALWLILMKFCEILTNSIFALKSLHCSVKFNFHFNFENEYETMKIDPLEFYFRGWITHSFKNIVNVYKALIIYAFSSY